ncbi:MAG: hypothetical protein ACTSUQ_04745 [Candidatus Freyarchaeota archaeon]
MPATIQPALTIDAVGPMPSSLTYMYHGEYPVLTTGTTRKGAGSQGTSRGSYRKHGVQTSPADRSCNPNYHRRYRKHTANQSNSRIYPSFLRTHHFHHPFKKGFRCFLNLLGGTRGDE